MTANHYIAAYPPEFLLCPQEIYVTFREIFFSTGLDSAVLQMWDWMCSVSTLTTERCLIIFLNDSDVGCSSHYHTVQILTHAIISYGAV
jgi:hypothetical protein